MIDSTDIVRCVNKDSVVVEMGWDSKVFRLEPGKDTFVPFSAMSNALGDPRSGELMISVKNEQGVVGWVPDRATEIRRLRARYDNQFGDERYVVNHPHVEVYTLEGERIITVLEDQDGTSVFKADQTKAEATGQAAEVATLRQKMVEMEERLQSIIQPTTEPPQPVEDPALAELLEDQAVTDDAVKAQSGMPPEDTGGDMTATFPEERTTPEKGSPSIDWASLSGSHVDTSE